ncbi:hypothetical protein [Acidianus sp. HS-5]|uniref:hypothetical protein n=1 Tax=Acidianus sp. HS-5 TaxID=2886040 RepID=UPI001F43C683|nr:hypothetical protein [Acidianus sp. HS-5]BDC19442.1 hypothetical protein HS5_23320 [Acidianus sp. HS-5]
MKKGFYLSLGIVLLIDIIIYSIYPLFNNVQPVLLGLTEFYWLQIALLIVTSLLYFAIGYVFKGENS